MSTELQTSARHLACSTWLLSWDPRCLGGCSCLSCGVGSGGRSGSLLPSAWSGAWRPGEAPAAHRASVEMPPRVAGCFHVRNWTAVWTCLRPASPGGRSSAGPRRAHQAGQLVLGFRWEAGPCPVPGVSTSPVPGSGLTLAVLGPPGRRMWPRPGRHPWGTVGRDGLSSRCARVPVFCRTAGDTRDLVQGRDRRRGAGRAEPRGGMCLLTSVPRQLLGELRHLGLSAASLRANGDVRS